MAESAFSALTWGRPITANMVGGLSDLRNIDLNLIYTIKETILPINGYVNQITETLSPAGQETDPDTGNIVTYYQTTYRDWVYYNPDPSNIALTGLLTEPILNSSGSLAWYDYPNGLVYFSGTLSSDLTITYDYYSVYVQDGFPDLGEDPYTIEALSVPLISVDFDRRDNTPFAIGGPYQEDRRFSINIVAASDAQRDDLANILGDSLRYDFNNGIDYRYGFPITFKGSINPLFDRGPGSRFKQFRFSDSFYKTIRLPDAPDKLRHQGVIMLDIQTN